MDPFRYGFNDSAGCFMGYCSDEKYLKEVKRITKDFRKKYGKEIADQYFNSEMRMLDSYHKELEKLKDSEDEPKGLLGEAAMVALAEDSRRKMTSLTAVLFEDTLNTNGCAERREELKDPNYKKPKGFGKDFWESLSQHGEEKMNLLIDVVKKERLKKS